MLGRWQEFQLFGSLVSWAWRSCSIGTNPSLNYSFLDCFVGSQQPSGSQADGAAGPDYGEVLVPPVIRLLEFNFRITVNSGALDQIGAFVDDPGVNGLALSPPTPTRLIKNIGLLGVGTLPSLYFPYQELSHLIMI